MDPPPRGRPGTIPRPRFSFRTFLGAEGTPEVVQPNSFERGTTAFPPCFTLTTPLSTANALELSPRRCYFLQSGPNYHCEGGSKGNVNLGFFEGCQYCKSLQSICALQGAHSLTESTYSGCVTHHRCYYLRIPCASIPTGPGIPSHPRCCSLASPRTGPPLRTGVAGATLTAFSHPPACPPP